MQMKVKFCLSHAMKSDGELQIHSFSKSALDGGRWSTSGAGRFTPKRKHRYALNRRMGGPHSRSERLGEEKNLLSIEALKF